MARRPRNEDSEPPKRRRADDLPYKITLLGVEGGCSLLTEACTLGADLGPAYFVLTYSERAHRGLGEWLSHRAGHGDPAVAAYLGSASVRDVMLFGRDALASHLDEHLPGLARRVVPGYGLVLKSVHGYWTGFDWNADRVNAKNYQAVWDWWGDARELDAKGIRVTPELPMKETAWRGLPPGHSLDPDPWGRALERVGKVPGCAWLDISAADRERMEGELFLDCLLPSEEYFHEVLRAAARFGHPLFTVYVDLSDRQGWDTRLRQELLALDRQYAPYRDSPGSVPELPPRVGPYFVLAGDGGYWNGTQLCPRLDEAERHPAWHPDSTAIVAAAKLVAERACGIPLVAARVDAHAAERTAEGDRQPKSGLGASSRGQRG